MANTLCTLYGPNLSPGVAKGWQALDKRLKEELGLHAKMRQTAGAIDMFINAAVMARGVANQPTQTAADLQFLDPMATHAKALLIMPKQLESYESSPDTVTSPSAVDS